MKTQMHFQKETCKEKNKYHNCGQKVLILVNFPKMNDFIVVNEGFTAGMPVVLSGG